MLSEFQHLDDFLRNKEEGISPDSSGADKHWQSLAPQLTAIHPVKPGRSIFRNSLKYAAGIIAAGVLLTIYLSKKNNTTTTIEPLSRVVSAPSNINEALIRIPVKKTGEVFFHQDNFTVRYFPKLTMQPILLPDHFYSLTNIYPDSNVTTTDTSEIVVADNGEVFESFYQQLEKKAEEFTVNSSRDTMLYCQEGSKLFIPANSFQTLTGLVISGMITIHVKEFYNYADIISNKLTTISDGKPLGTGGMLNIKALAQDEELKLKPGSTLQIQMPTRIFNPKMQLFTGEINNEKVSANSNTPAINDSLPLFGRTSLNWVPQGQQQFYLRDQFKIIKVLNVMNNPSYVDTDKKGKTTGKFVIPFYSDISVSDMKQVIEERYPNYYDRVKVKRKWKPISRKGRIRRENVATEWNKTSFVGDSINISLSMATRLKIITRQDSAKWEVIFKKRYEDMLKREEAYGQYLQMMDKYQFNLGQMGWVNCDYFAAYNNSQVTPLTINVEEGFDAAFVQTTLIVKRENVAIPGIYRNGKISFFRLPIGQEVSLVCLGVKNGKAYSSIKHFRVDKNSQQKLDLEETTPEKFKNELRYLGNVTGRG